MNGNLLGIQIIGILFGLLMVYVSVLHSKRKEFTSKESVFWMIVWSAFVLVAIFPNSIDFLGKDILGMSRTMDFLIILGFIVLAGLLFYVYGLMRTFQRKLEQLVRKIAHERVKK